MHKFGVVLFTVIALAMTLAAPLSAKPMLGWPEGDNGSAVGQAVIQVVLNFVIGAPAWVGINLGWPDEEFGWPDEEFGWPEGDPLNGADSDGFGTDEGQSPNPPGQKPPEPKVVPTTWGGIKYNGGR